MAKEEILKSILEAATGVNVYALEKPKGNNNCITYRIISSKVYRSHSGKSNLIRERFLLTCYAENISGLKALADSVLNILEANTTDFVLSTCENISDNPKQIDTNLYSKELEFFIW